MVTSTLALVWVIFFVHEPMTQPERKPEKTLANIVLRPMRDTVATLVKVRPHGLRRLLWLQLLVFASYLFFYEEVTMIYLYGRKVFPGFDGADYAAFLTMQRVVGFVTLLFVVPFLSLKLRWHESTILMWISFFTALSNLLSAFAPTFLLFFLAQALSSGNIAQFATSRSLMTKHLDEDEFGKLFAFMSLLQAVVKIGSNPAFHQLYSHTLETFPAAFLLLVASCGTFEAFANLFLYSQKYRIAWFQDDLSKAREDEAMTNVKDEANIPKDEEESQTSFANDCDVTVDGNAIPSSNAVQSSVAVAERASD